MLARPEPRVALSAGIAGRLGLRLELLPALSLSETMADDRVSKMGNGSSSLLLEVLPPPPPGLAVGEPPEPEVTIVPPR